MKIEMNRDLAEKPADIMNKMGKKEIITVILIVVIGTAITMFSTFGMGLPMSVSINLVIPVAVVLGILGFFEKDGMSVGEIALRYLSVSGIIHYHSTETPVPQKAPKNNKGKKGNIKPSNRKRTTNLEGRV